MTRALTIQTIILWAGIAVAQMPVTSKLKDLEFERTAPNVLTFGRECSARTPCNVRFNQRTHSITTGGTVVLSEPSPKGKAFAYVTSDGKVNIASKLSIRCTGCVAVPGADYFPANAIPLWTWTATSAAGVWDRDGGEDWRGFQSTQVIIPGPGIMVTQSPDATKIGVDTVALQLFVHNTPSSSSAACTPGAIWSDANYIYVCVASGTIKRAALSSF